MNPVQNDSSGAILHVNTSCTHGTLEDNIATLQQKLEASSLRTHLKAVQEVGKYIVANGPMVCTQDAGKVYMCTWMQRDYQLRNSQMKSLASI